MRAADAVEAIAVEVFRQCEWRRKVDVMAAHAWCPQWWSVFSVQGNTETYEVYSNHVLCGTWRCGCRGSMFGFRCKHIRRVLRHGCLAGPDPSAAGRNDLGDAVRVSITNTPNPVPRATKPTGRPCVCGEMMLAPLLRIDDGAGHQIVEVQIDGGRAQYAYAWGGQRALSRRPSTRPRSRFPRPPRSPAVLPVERTHVLLRLEGACCPLWRPRADETQLAGWV